MSQHSTYIMTLTNDPSWQLAVKNILGNAIIRCDQMHSVFCQSIKSPILIPMLAVRNEQIQVSNRLKTISKELDECNLIFESMDFEVISQNDQNGQIKDNIMDHAKSLDEISNNFNEANQEYHQYLCEFHEDLKTLIDTCEQIDKQFPLIIEWSRDRLYLELNYTPPSNNTHEFIKTTQINDVIIAAKSRRLPIDEILKMLNINQGKCVLNNTQDVITLMQLQLITQYLFDSSIDKHSNPTPISDLIKRTEHIIKQQINKLEECYQQEWLTVKCDSILAHTNTLLERISQIQDVLNQQPVKEQSKEPSEQDEPTIKPFSVNSKIICEKLVNDAKKIKDA